MSQANADLDALARRKIARRYKLLGYDVVENPNSDLLPDFMQGVTPGIIARSPSDNVVIEVKKHSSLKGSNDLIRIAEGVSGHPDWRFELVVLDQDAEGTRPIDTGANYEKLLARFDSSRAPAPLDIAYVYLTFILVSIARDLATKYNVKARQKTGPAIFEDLGFRGILPDDLVEGCLSALSIRNKLAHEFDGKRNPSEADFKALLQLCGELRQFL